jgi:hypothetical protein
MAEIGAGFEQVEFRTVLAAKPTANGKHLFPDQTVTNPFDEGKSDGTIPLFWGGT